LDQATFRAVAERCANLTNTEIDVLVCVDIDVIPPHVVPDFIACDDLRSSSDKKFKYSQGLPLQVDSDAPVRNEMLHKVNLELSKTNDIPPSPGTIRRHRVTP
jgi:hypothetical protein